MQLIKSQTVTAFYSLHDKAIKTTYSQYSKVTVIKNIIFKNKLELTVQQEYTENTISYYLC